MEFKRCLLLFILITSFSFGAKAESEEDYQKRVEWVLVLKDLFIEIEQRSPQDLTTYQKEFKKNFSFIDSAWASSKDCFFAGWPSEVRSSAGKKFCTSPLNLKSGYQQGSCSQGQLQCQPLLFGKDVCVAFKTPQDKGSAFSKCDEVFKASGKDHSFLKNLSPQEANDLQNLSVSAHKVCEEGSVGIQKGTGMCKKLMEKFDDGMLSIARSQVKVTENPRPALLRGKPMTQELSALPKKQETRHQHDEDCPAEHLNPINSQVAKNFSQTTESLLEDGYEKLKQSFMNSEFCKPENVLYAPDKPNALLLNQMISDLSFLDQVKTPERWHQNRFQELLQKYKVSGNTEVTALRLFSINSMQEVKRVLLQDYTQNAKAKNTILKDEIAKELVRKNVFKASQSGKPECPFMSKDSYVKAIKGMQKVKGLSGVSNSSLLTIVDYTRPSHERRLFVIDINQNKVMHNTWVAHGGGGNNVFGTDGKGGSPTMSNASGSNQSSDGFVVAGAPSYGSRFGNNLILNGVDRNNSNMRSRAVIMHGWDSPGEQVVNGLKGYNGTSSDIGRDISSLSHTTSKEAFNRVLQNARQAAFVDNFLRPTEGCLGVPNVSMPHLDPKGRNQSVIDVLRQDLKGSVIFNYSGPSMQSKYF